MLSFISYMFNLIQRKVTGTSSEEEIAFQEQVHMQSENKSSLAKVRTKDQKTISDYFPITSPYLEELNQIFTNDKKLENYLVDSFLQVQKKPFIFMLKKILKGGFSKVCVTLEHKVLKNQKLQRPSSTCLSFLHVFENSNLSA